MPTCASGEDLALCLGQIRAPSVTSGGGVLLCSVCGQSGSHHLPILLADLLDEPEEKDEWMSYRLEPGEPLASLSPPSPPTCLLHFIPTVQRGLCERAGDPVLLL